MFLDYPLFLALLRFGVGMNLIILLAKSGMTVDEFGIGFAKLFEIRNNMEY
jgi:hypothetical protein